MSTPPATAPDRIIRLPEVKHLTGLSRSSIYSKVSTDTFPAPLKLSVKMVGWRLSEVEAWIGRPR